jgi:hypothetical protein
LSVSEFGFSDLYDSVPPNSLVAIRITTLPTFGALFLGDSQLTTPFAAVIPTASIFAGQFRFVPAANANGVAYSQFAFQVQDDGGTFAGGVDVDPTPNTITFNVTPVNDSPSFTLAVFSPLADESGPVSMPGWATQVSVGPADESGQHAQYFVVGNTNPGIFLTPPAIDANGILSFTPMPNSKGAAQLTVVLKDDGGTADGGNDTSLPQTLTIEVFKARAMHNALKPLDVVGDGSIVAGDALEIINFLNAFRAQRVPNDGRTEGPYYDCDGDGFVTAADALEVINHLNAFGPDVEGASGDGESAGLRSQASGVSGQATWDSGLEELTTLLAMDVAEESRKKKD